MIPVRGVPRSSDSSRKPGTILEPEEAQPSPDFFPGIFEMIEADERSLPGRPGRPPDRLEIPQAGGGGGYLPRRDIRRA
ncbi:MAG: hypothetical protein M0C28_48215 [Candidatus Moduliflexus flocculans]|nr:hypothetical protein [Candidatus Moduliflexus flocculans]